MRRLLLLWMLAMPVIAAELTTDQQRRYQALIAEIRCLVCQNQNIADSNAPLAEDLRIQVREMILAGDSDTQIKTYIVERYGDFALYRPPVKPQTLLLWAGPFILLLIGLLVAWRLYRRSNQDVDTAAPDAASLERLLREDETE